MEASRPNGGESALVFAAWLYLTAPFSILRPDVYVGSIAVLSSLQLYLIERMAKDGAGLEDVLAGLCFPCPLSTVFTCFLFRRSYTQRLRTSTRSGTFFAPSRLLLLLWYGLRIASARAGNVARSHKPLLQMGALGLTRSAMCSMDMGILRGSFYFHDDSGLFGRSLSGSPDRWGEKVFCFVFASGYDVSVPRVCDATKILKQGSISTGFRFVFVGKGLDDVMDQQWFRKFRTDPAFVCVVRTALFNSSSLFLSSGGKKHLSADRPGTRGV